jgi:hypothetical protein
MVTSYNLSMAYDEQLNSPYPPPYLTRPARRRRRWLEGLLLVGFTLCLLVGLAALAVLWRLSTNPAPILAPNDPLTTLRTERILPTLALAELAGDPPDALANQALSAGQLETARALLIYRRQQQNERQLGLLLYLARDYVAAEEPAIATLLLHQARAYALLDGTLGSLERSQALLQIAQELHAAGADSAARDAAIQSFRVARGAPELLPAQRSQLFSSLRPLVEQLADDTVSQQIAEFARNPFVTASGEIPALTRLWSLPEAVPADAGVVTALATRQQRARELVNRLAFTGGADIDPERAALAQALLAEDAARSALVGTMQGAGFTSGQQLTLLLEQRDWLLLKLRIASLGFGLSLVPEWETGRALLQRDLSAVTSALDTTFQALAAAQPDPLDQALLRLEARRWLALQSDLGQYPGVGPETLGQRISASQAELAQLGHPVALPFGYDPSAVPPGFRIAAP